MRALTISLATAILLVTASSHSQTNTTQQGKLIEPGVVMLRPYTARYNVRFHGISGGDIEATLKSSGNGRFIFRSHLLPNLLGRLFTSDQAEDVSELELTSEGIVRPLRFQSEDGSSNTEKDIKLEFDWSNNSVKGRAENKDFTMSIPLGTQERLTIQLAASLALQANHDPGTLTMLERNELQQFTITRHGIEHVKTDAGEYDAVVLNSERVGGSSRSTRYWYAQSLGFIPVRAERSSHGKVDIVMELKSVKLGE